MEKLTIEWILSKLGGYTDTTIQMLAEAAINERLSPPDIRGNENTKFLYEHLETLLSESRNLGYTTRTWGSKVTIELNVFSPHYDKKTDSIFNPEIKFSTDHGQTWTSQQPDKK